MKNLKKIAAGVALSATMVAGFTPTLALADTEAQLWADCYSLSQPGKLYPGAVDQDMLFVAIGNMHETKNLRVSKIGVKLTGTLAPSDILAVHFRFLNNNGNVVNLPDTTFNGSGLAELTGAPLFTIPVGWTRDVIVSVDVSPTAPIGATASFDISASNFDYMTNTPPSLVTVGQACQGINYTVGAVPAPTNLTFNMVSPNGGEVWQIGQRVSVKWGASNMPTGSYFCKVDLLKAGSVLTTVRNMSPGYTVQGIAWQVGASAATGGTPDPIVIPGNNYKIRAYLCNQAGTVIKQATSAANFRIKA